MCLIAWLLYVVLGSNGIHSALKKWISSFILRIRSARKYLLYFAWLPIWVYTVLFLFTEVSAWCYSSCLWLYLWTAYINVACMGAWISVRYHLIHIEIYRYYWINCGEMISGVFYIYCSTHRCVLCNKLKCAFTFCNSLNTPELLVTNAKQGNLTAAMSRCLRNFR